MVTGGLNGRHSQDMGCREFLDSEEAIAAYLEAVGENDEALTARAQKDVARARALTQMLSAGVHPKIAD